MGKRIGLIGASGMVGREMMRVLLEHGYGDWELLPAASERSSGRTVRYGSGERAMLSVKELLASRPDYVLNATEAEVALEWGPRFAGEGVYFIDNSSAWRMADGVPLVVPEINARRLARGKYIVANPNCSTIQLVMVLAPLHAANPIRRVHVSTYQAVSGSGVKGLRQMEQERLGEPVEEPAYGYRIDQNCIAQCDSFQENGYTKEEMKVANETRKILEIPDLLISATAVRVPVRRGHSEAVSIEFTRPISVGEVREILGSSAGVVLVDEPGKGAVPTALESEGHDEVYVGRIREDLAVPGIGINLWVVSDNLRKGAATNAVQILDSVVSLCACAAR